MSKFGLGIAVIVFATALSVADFAIARGGGGHGGGHGGGRGGGPTVVAMAVVIMVVVDTISAAGIMAAAIFTAGRRISVRSPAIVHSPHAVRSPRNA